MFSNNDRRKNIIIPDILTPKLAEFIGIMVGDGHVGFSKYVSSKRTAINYEIRISGNLKDLDYYSQYTNSLAYELFNIKFQVLEIKYDNSVMLYRNSKAMYCFFSQCLSIPQRKDHIQIPKQILNSTLEIKSAFLRELADSDFTFTLKRKEGRLYPVVQGSSKSKMLIDEVSSILKDLKINHCIFFERSYYKRRDKIYERYAIYINGFSNVSEWFSKIGFSNKRHEERYLEFMKINAPEGIRIRGEIAVAKSLPRPKG